MTDLEKKKFILDNIEAIESWGMILVNVKKARELPPGLSFQAYVSPGGGIYIDQEYVDLIKSEIESKQCSTCNNWTGQTKKIGQCPQASFKLLTSAKGNKVKAHPQLYTEHDDCCDDWESKF